MVFNFITGNPQIGLDGVKSFCSFAGMILNVNLIAQISKAMYLFPRKFPWKELTAQGSKDQGVAAVYMWFEIEWMIFAGTILSNIIFLMIRSCERHKIQLDRMPVRK